VLELQSILINEDILNAKFACNLGDCKGICCCLDGGRGAPLSKSEIKTLKLVFEKIKHHIPSKTMEIIEKYGLFEEDDGDFYITCINDKDCVFVYRDDGIAKCIIEKAFNNGEIDWQKPISCHLYPIRINEFGGDILRYSKIMECESARKNGNENNIYLVDFLESPLTRKYGKIWYDNLKYYCDSLKKEKN
jgi:hypothetical protein